MTGPCRPDRRLPRLASSVNPHLAERIRAAAPSQWAPAAEPVRRLAPRRAADWPGAPPRISDDVKGPSPCAACPLHPTPTLRSPTRPCNAPVEPANLSHGRASGDDRPISARCAPRAIVTRRAPLAQTPRPRSDAHSLSPPCQRPLRPDEKKQSPTISHARRRHWPPPGPLAKAQTAVPDIGNARCGASRVTAPLLVTAMPARPSRELLCAPCFARDPQYSWSPRQLDPHTAQGPKAAMALLRSVNYLSRGTIRGSWSPSSLTLPYRSSTVSSRQAWCVLAVSLRSAATILSV